MLFAFLILPSLIQSSSDSVSRETLTCIIGYYYNRGQCVPCPGGCQICSSKSSCSTCLPGFSLDNGICIKCFANCQDCVSSSQCTTCNPGYGLSKNKCVQCDSGCRDCNSSACTQCYIGWHLVDGVCISNSVNCARYGDICFECNPGYFKGVDGWCVACPTGCANCTDANNCTACSDWYWLKNNQCVSCGGSCMTCGSTGCVLCYIGYHLDNGVCVSNSLNCEIFADVCLKCKSGYYLENGLCQACSEGCNDCTRLNECNGCFDGYELTGQKCTKIKRNLREKYVGCPVGFYIHEEGCVQCSHPCTICNQLFCSQCAEGFSLSEGSCI